MSGCPGLCCKFRTAGYTIGDEDHPLDVIEHGLLRDNRRPRYSARRTLASGDRRLEGAPKGLDPRVHFAVNCGARSCPPVRPYSAASVDRESGVNARLGRCSMNAGSGPCTWNRSVATSSTRSTRRTCCSRPRRSGRCSRAPSTATSPSPSSPSTATSGSAP
ncbi:MAG: DUF547 domain-containing protein [Solirubrobacterales bacterium]|nr:DUF547 domain-containing protein [Solirubrobacterales bacterium]